MPGFELIGKEELAEVEHLLRKVEFYLDIVLITLETTFTK